VAEKVPTAHSVQAAWPETDEKVPAAQEEQLEAPGPEVRPAGHTVGTLVATVAQLLPAGQVEQTAAPWHMQENK
jgi:hypothetical protein